MGNRAVITLENHKGEKHPVALYVHWHGGLESTLAFVEYTWATFDRGRDDIYTFHARLCQVIGNLFCDGLSLYGYPFHDADDVAEGCDNGRFHFVVGPKGVSLPGREDEVTEARQHEYWTRDFPIQASLKRAMPTRDESYAAKGGTAPPGVVSVS